MSCTIPFLALKNEGPYFCVQIAYMTIFLSHLKRWR